MPQSPHQPRPRNGEKRRDTVRDKDANVTGPKGSGAYAEPGFDRPEAPDGLPGEPARDATVRPVAREG